VDQPSDTSELIITVEEMKPDELPKLQKPKGEVGYAASGNKGGSGEELMRASSAGR